MNTPLQPAEELALIDRELVQLDARRAYLLGRRDWLLHLLRMPAPAPPVAGAVPGTAPKAPAPSAQTVLLTLGAVLLAVAALAFTLVGWGSLGIVGRSAVLALLTTAAAAVPTLLLRRGLRSTAESVVAVALLLTLLDAYALHVVALPDTDPVAYAAWAAAALAALWAGYAVAPGRLRLPPVAAICAAQLPLPLAAAAAGADVAEGGWALLATAALDATLAVLVVRRAVRIPAASAAGLLGAGALTAALAAAVDSPGSVGPAALLAAAALLGVAVAWRAPKAWAAAVVGGLAGVSAVGALLPAGTGAGWAVAARVAVACALAAAVVRAPALPEPVRRGLLRAGVWTAALAGLWAAPAAAVLLVSRLGVLTEVWAATTPHAEGITRGVALPVILLLVAAALARPAGALPARESRVAAVVCGWAALFTAPMLTALPVAGVLGAQLAVTAAAGAVALRVPARAVAGAAGVCAVVGALNLSVAALDGRAATFAVLGLLGVGGASAAAYGPAARPLRAGGAVAAVSYAAALLGALGALTGLSPAWIGVGLLALPAVVAAVGPRLGPVRGAAEAASVGVGVAAVALGAGDPTLLALVLALGGVICAGAALRPERRAALWAAGALGVLATWVRLGASGVTVPEAYTLPVTVLALAVGVLRRRREPATASWPAYGPGLAATLLPSLWALWADPHWLRPLLLGLGALAVTLVGARRGLRAPLLLGGAALAAVALHELAPYVVQVVGALPRWLPPALVGALLLAVGATYEKRLRDARRLRGALGRLR
ncbi:SCO7613 C-terminal domain-containing membrane protein [Streptomyces sp. NPDC088097]|uniref:SCO7613 C-terminal domain-containing membrane protein n=1 Tax=Streptomyces sp. NPDC088097 TaxID=3365823 RepID=UPI003827B0FF